jgi:hypothetical protein
MFGEVSGFVTVPILANMPPCSRCNISFVPFEGTQFWTRTPTCLVQAFVTDRGRAFSKQSILRNPAARPAERECSAGLFKRTSPRLKIS